MLCISEPSISFSVSYDCVICDKIKNKRKIRKEKEKEKKTKFIVHNSDILLVNGLMFFWRVISTESL